MAVRLLAFLCALAALAGLALAARDLNRVLRAPAPDTVAAQPGGAQPQPPTPAPPVPPAQAWPPLFGTLVVPEPQPPTPPQPPAPPAPPLSSLGFTLKGTATLNGETWAILAHPTGERILRVGDLLAEGLQVVAIDDSGLWVGRNGGREVLEFSQ